MLCGSVNGVGDRFWMRNIVVVPAWHLDWLNVESVRRVAEHACLSHCAVADRQQVGRRLSGRIDGRDIGVDL